MVHTFNGILLRYWKEHFWISPNEVEEARVYYTKWSKSEREKQVSYAAAAAKSLQSCPTLCNPIDGSPPGFPVPGILQARTLEWVAISFFNTWKWKVKVKSLSRVRPSVTPWTAAYQTPPSMGFSRLWPQKQNSANWQAWKRSQMEWDHNRHFNSSLVKLKQRDHLLCSELLIHRNWDNQNVLS